MKVLLIAGLGLALTVQTAYSQTPVGQVLGTVRDSSNLQISQAVVVVNNEDTGQRSETVSDDFGDYQVRALPPGNYSVAVEKQGFKKFVRRGVSVSSFQNVRVDALLEIGALTQTVTVVGEAPLVDTRSATSGTLIDDKRITQLPLNGRNVVNFATLIPGVTRINITGATGTDPNQRVNVNGNRSYSTNMQLDGGSMYYSETGGSMNMPPPDAVQEIKMITSGVSAEYGRGTAQLSVVTRSGTNELHGSLWNYLRNDKLDARRFFDPGKAKLRFNQFGGTVGGPILHNRLFFFGSYQGNRVRQESSATSAFPPTAAERAGDFSNSNPAPEDPLTGQPFPNRMIPRSRMDPVALKLLEKIPLPNDPSGRLSVLAASPTTADNVVGKFDYTASTNDRLNFRYYFDYRRGINAFPVLDSPSSNIGGYAPNIDGAEVRSYSASHVRTWTPNLLMSTRGSLARATVTGASTVRESLADLGAQNFVNAAGEPRLPQIVVTGRFSASPGKDRDRPGDTYDFAQDWTLVRGRHELKWGAQVTRIGWLSTNNHSSSARFLFDGSHTRNNMADFLLGRSVSFNQNSLETEVGKYYVPAFYFQNNWKATRRLTLNLGLRWEIYTPWRSEQGAQVLFKPGVRSRTFPTAPAGMVFQSDPEYDYNADNMNIGPRIGFAWDVFGDGKTAVRGGYSVSFDGPIAEGTAATNQPFTLWITESNPGPLSNPYANSRNPFPYAVNPQNAVFFLPATIDGNIATPFEALYSQNLSLMVQRQLSTNWMVQVGYIGNLGRKLPAPVEGNPAIYRPGATTGNTDARRIYAPDFRSFRQVRFDTISNYHALQTMAVKRLSRGFTLVSHYTWSKAIDETCTSESRGNCRMQDPGNRRGERGLGSYDRRHVVVFSYLYDIPLFRNGNRALRTGLGGWQIAGINTFQSGSPVDVRTGRDLSLRGINFDRPDVVGDPELAGNRSKAEQIAMWFNTAAFQQNLPGQFGNAGRNVIIGPGAWNWDVSLQKTFPVAGERRQLEFRSDFFNVLNHANLGDPQANLSSPQTFGRITSTGAARVIQFALRFGF